MNNKIIILTRIIIRIIIRFIYDNLYTFAVAAENLFSVNHTIRPYFKPILAVCKIFLGIAVLSGTVLFKSLNRLILCCSRSLHINSVTFSSDCLGNCKFYTIHCRCYLCTDGRSGRLQFRTVCCINSNRNTNQHKQ